MAVALLSLHSCKEDIAPKQLPPQKITVVEVIQKNVPIYDEMVGQVFGLKDIPIRARVDGYLEKISFSEGSRVEKGQLLYTIDALPFEADVAAYQSKLAEAKTILVNAENELERYKPLAEMNAVSKSDLDAAQANRDAAVASVDAAKANLKSAEINLSYTVIHSPIGGMIGKTEAREGEYVGREPNPVILNTVSRIDTVRVQFSISESKYLAISRAYRKTRTEEEIVKDAEAGETKLNVELILSDGSKYEEKGKIDFVNNQIDANTGSLLIQASFPNTLRILRPGMYAKVRIELETAQDALLVPQRCVTELQGGYSVFVVGDDNIVVSRQVELGARVGDLWLVETGLKPGEKVVIDALQKVRSGLEVVPVVTEFESKTEIL